MFSHEAAHVVAGHAFAKLSFMAEILGKDKVPTARTALLEFLAKDTYAAAYQPTALLQEREADAVGAAILFASGYDPLRALGLFDKLSLLDKRRASGPPTIARDRSGLSLVIGNERSAGRSGRAKRSKGSLSLLYIDEHEKITRSSQHKITASGTRKNWVSGPG